MKVNQTNSSEIVSTNSVAAATKASILLTKEVFEILGSKLYKNKIKAPIQELGTNAYDAHLLVGKQNVPFEVKLPNSLDGTFYIKDFGPGLSREQMTSMYMQYFNSSKRQDENSTGFFGLGSKTPACYTDMYTVTSVHNGEETSYVIAKDSDGFPCIQEFSESRPASDDWKSGLKVSFSVKVADQSRFVEEAQNVFRWFAVPPVVKGSTRSIHSLKYSLETANFGYVSQDVASLNSSFCKMGNVSYPLDGYYDLLPLVGEEYAEFMSLDNMVLFVPMGAVFPVVSREALDYNKETVDYLKTHMRKVKSDLVKICHKQIEAFHLSKEKATTPELIARTKLFKEAFALAYKGFQKQLKEAGETDSLIVSWDNSEALYSWMWTGSLKMKSLFSDWKSMPQSVDLMMCESHFPLRLKRMGKLINTGYIATMRRNYSTDSYDFPIDSKSVISFVVFDEEKEAVMIRKVRHAVTSKEISIDGLSQNRTTHRAFFFRGTGAAEFAERLKEVFPLKVQLVKTSELPDPAELNKSTMAAGVSIRSPKLKKSATLDQMIDHYSDMPALVYTKPEKGSLKKELSIEALVGKKVVAYINCTGFRTINDETRYNLITEYPINEYQFERAINNQSKYWDLAEDEAVVVLPKFFLDKFEIAKTAVSYPQYFEQCLIKELAAIKSHLESSTFVIENSLKANRCHQEKELHNLLISWFGESPTSLDSSIEDSESFNAIAVFMDLFFDNRSYGAAPAQELQERFAEIFEQLPAKAQQAIRLYCKLEGNQLTKVGKGYQLEPVGRTWKPANVSESLERFIELTRFTDHDTMVKWFGPTMDFAKMHVKPIVKLIRKNSVSSSASVQEFKGWEVFNELCGISSLGHKDKETFNRKKDLFLTLFKTGFEFISNRT